MNPVGTPKKHDPRITTHQMIRTTAEAAKRLSERLDESKKFILAAAVTAFADLPVADQVAYVLAARRAFAADDRATPPTDSRGVPPTVPQTPPPDLPGWVARYRVDTPSGPPLRQATEPGGSKRHVHVPGGPTVTADVEADEPPPETSLMVTRRRLGSKQLPLPRPAVAAWREMFDTMGAQRHILWTAVVLAFADVPGEEQTARVQDVGDRRPREAHQFITVTVPGRALDIALGIADRADKVLPRVLTAAMYHFRDLTPDARKQWVATARAR